MIRVGKISSIDHEAYTAAIVYADENGEEDNVTADLSFLMNGLYLPPEVDDQVWVAHREDASEDGVILGRASSEKFKPEFEGKKGLFRLWMSRGQEDCFLEYDPDTEKLRVFNKKDIERESETGNITDKSKGHKIDVDGDAEITATGNININGSANITIHAGAQLNLTGSGGTINWTGSGTLNVNGTIVASGINLATHTHAFASANAGGPVAGVTMPPS